MSSVTTWYWLSNKSPHDAALNFLLTCSRYREVSAVESLPLMKDVVVWPGCREEDCLHTTPAWCGCQEQGNECGGDKRLKLSPALDSYSVCLQLQSQAAGLRTVVGSSWLTGCSRVGHTLRRLHKPETWETVKRLSSDSSDVSRGITKMNQMQSGVGLWCSDTWWWRSKLVLHLRRPKVTHHIYLFNFYQCFCCCGQNIVHLYLSAPQSFSLFSDKDVT